MKIKKDLQKIKPDKKCVKLTDYIDYNLKS